MSDANTVLTDMGHNIDTNTSDTDKILRKWYNSM